MVHRYVVRMHPNARSWIVLDRLVGQAVFTSELEDECIRKAAELNKEERPSGE